MGLDCLPRHPDGALAGIPDGLTHAPSAPCPFRDDFPVGPVGSCCSLRGKAAARELEALGETTLYERMFKDMTPGEALGFAFELRHAADSLERAHADDREKPKGAGWDGIYDEEKGEVVWQTYSTFDEALAEIRTAANWYEKVGNMGFGVHAWF